MTTPRRKPLTITDEGDGKFVVTVGDRYSSPDYRWNMIGIVIEWLHAGDDLEWLATADDHARDQAIFDEIMRNRPEGNDQ